MAAELIQRRKLSTEVRERLLSLIHNGDLRPGDRLPSERELMTRYGVGRPAVREAMQSLESDGLIEINHGERARVALISARDMIGRVGQTALHLLQTSPQTLEHLKQARLMFEVGMVRVAARKASPEDITNLEELLRKQKLVESDAKEFVQTDMEFHTAIATISGNPIIAAVSESMLEWLFTFRRDMLRVEGAEKITLSEHRRILKAIRAHDEDAAAQAMTDHLTRSSQRYRALTGS